jgi:hypothetical protein
MREGERAARKIKSKASSIRGGTRFWGPIELAEITLNATGRLAIFFFANLLKKDRWIRSFLRPPFWLLETCLGLNVPNS